jgi:hypothetical protein
MLFFPTCSFSSALSLLLCFHPQRNCSFSSLLCSTLCSASLRSSFPAPPTLLIPFGELPSSAHPLLLILPCSSSPAHPFQLFFPPLLNCSTVPALPILLCSCSAPPLCCSITLGRPFLCSFRLTCSSSAVLLLSSAHFIPLPLL